MGSKIAVVEKKLYGGSVKNPRELTPFQQDLEILKGQRAEREDKLLALMMDVDSLQQDVGLKKSDFEKIEQRMAGEPAEAVEPASRVGDRVGPAKAKEGHACESNRFCQPRPL